VHISSRWTRQ